MTPSAALGDPAIGDVAPSEPLPWPWGTPRSSRNAFQTLEIDIDTASTIQDIGGRNTGALSRMAHDNGRKKQPVQERRAGPLRDRLKTSGRATGSRNDKTIVAEVGVRLKQLRTRAGFTLEELCVASGVSRAMLSNVERGEKSPTLTVLVRIAAGLGVSLSTLMGAEPTVPAATVIRANKRLSFKDPETGFERQILSPNHVENGVELLLHRVPPGASSGTLPPYNVPTEKLLVVHEGQLTVWIGERHYDLKCGDSFYFEVREPYRFVNSGRTESAYYLVIVQSRT